MALLNESTAQREYGARVAARAFFPTGQPAFHNTACPSLLHACLLSTARRLYGNGHGHVSTAHETCRADGGTPITYPGSGTSFLLPLRPPYTSATIVMCGGSWGNFNQLDGVRQPKSKPKPEPNIHACSACLATQKPVLLPSLLTCALLLEQPYVGGG